MDLDSALKGFVEPSLNTSLGEAKALRSATLADGKAQIDIELGFPAERYGAALKSQLQNHLQAHGIEQADIQVRSNIQSHAVQTGLKPLAGIKNVIVVASGKGGVGKSTVAVNLALALKEEGATVGLLDADIYGPSQPRMVGAEGKPDTNDELKKLLPKRALGLQTMSIGYLVDESQPMIWRGPMVSQALNQLLNETLWEDLDYLVVDMPPGTGDIQLSMAQKIPVSGAVVVTTPQEVAVMDARKGLKMFEKVKVPILGVVENMSTHLCSNCGHEEHIFGQGGGAALAAESGVRVLASLPLQASIGEQSDNGLPTVAADPDGPAAALYRQLARSATAQLSLQTKTYAAKFPKISVVPA